MSTNEENASMARRALLTEHERDALLDRESNDARYVAVSRVRKKIDEELTRDVEVLRHHDEEHNTDLLDRVRDAVCEDVENEDIAVSDSSEDTIDPVVEDDRTDIEATEGVYDDLGERVEPEEETRAAEDVLRDLDSLSGSGSNYEARVNAVVTFYEYLRDHRGEHVSRGDLKDLAETTGLEVGYASFASLWNNWVKANESQGRDFNTLAQLPGVEMDGSDYVYTGEVDE